METLNDNYLNNTSDRYKVRIEDLTFDFAKRIVFLRKDLISSDIEKEFVIQTNLKACDQYSGKCHRSGTSTI